MSALNRWRAEWLRLALVRSDGTTASHATIAPGMGARVGSSSICDLTDPKDPESSWDLVDPDHALILTPGSQLRSSAPDGTDFRQHLARTKETRAVEHAKFVVVLVDGRHIFGQFHPSEAEALKAAADYARVHSGADGGEQ